MFILIFIILNSVYANVLFLLPFQSCQVHVNFFGGVVTQDNAFAQFRKVDVSGQVGDGPAGVIEQWYTLPTSAWWGVRTAVHTLPRISEQGFGYFFAHDVRHASDEL